MKYVAKHFIIIYTIYLYRIGLSDGALKTFITRTADMDPEARGRALEEDESIATAHEQCAAEGQTAVSISF